jgi:hypothetical protein
MNAKRIHPTSYHQHNGVFRAETAVMKVSFVTRRAIWAAASRVAKRRWGAIVESEERWHR